MKRKSETSQSRGFIGGQGCEHLIADVEKRPLLAQRATGGLYRLYETRCIRSSPAIVMQDKIWISAVDRVLTLLRRFCCRKEPDQHNVT